MKQKKDRGRREGGKLQYFKYFNQKGAINRGRAIIRGFTVFIYSCYTKGHKGTCGIQNARYYIINLTKTKHTKDMNK